MINPKYFYNLLKENGIDFFSGVPDSLLKNICAYITDNTIKEKNIIAANEGGAIALGTGYHLATGKIPLIYMQNSGLGNAINPLLSLADKKVYSIPMILMIGWRGEPGTKDEPQHIAQGRDTLELLDAMDIPYEIVPDNIEKANSVVESSLKFIRENNCPLALIIKKNLFEPYLLQNQIQTNYDMNREDAIKLLVGTLGEDDIVVSTTGKTSRELFEFRREGNLGHDNDFLTVGSMGHASQIALGIALQKPNKQVFCFDGDGAIIMHAGALGIIGDLAPKNFRHVLFNNGCHDSVGGQPTIGFKTDFVKIAEAFNYKYVEKAKTRGELNLILNQFKSVDGPAFLEIYVNKGARKDLGRPTTLPLENKISFMKKYQG